MRIQAQPVGSSTVSQSGYHQVHQEPVDTNSNVVAVPRVASPVDSTVSQSVAAMNREPSIAETSSSNGEGFAPMRPALPLYPQSEVTTSGGSPPVDISQGRRDLELNQLHGEAEIVEQNRRVPHINGYGDMDEAVSSISGQEQVQQRHRAPVKSNRDPMEDMDMSGEPDTTQDDGEEFQQNDYSQSSSIDEAEALHSTMAPRPSQALHSTGAPRPSQALHSSAAPRLAQARPSASNVIDSVMENQQLSSTQLAPHARMTSLTASLFNSNQQYRPSQSSYPQMSANQIGRAHV